MFYDKKSLNLVKDITRIGRPIEKTIIVDNISENFAL